MPTRPKLTIGLQDPNTRLQFMAMLATEGSGLPTAESAMNRMLLTHKGVLQMLHSGFYGFPWTLSPTAKWTRCSPTGWRRHSILTNRATRTAAGLRAAAVSKSTTRFAYAAPLSTPPCTPRWRRRRWPTRSPARAACVRPKAYWRPSRMRARSRRTCASCATAARNLRARA